MLTEILLDVVSFADYATLVLMKLANKCLLRFVDKHAETLAIRRAFSLTFRKAEFEVADFRDLRLDRVFVKLDANDADSSTALAELKAIIGPHVVEEVELYELSIPVKRLVDFIPGMRDVSNVFVYLSAPLCVEDMAAFKHPDYMCLGDMPFKTVMATMQHGCTSKATMLRVSAPANEQNNVLDMDAEDAILRFCTADGRLEQNKSRRIDLCFWRIRWTFVERLIEALVRCKRIVTVTLEIPEEVPNRSFEVGNGGLVNYWELPLCNTSFEPKGVGIDHFLRGIHFREHPWVKLAHLSRQTGVVVFVSECELTVTNNPKHIEYETMDYGY